MLKYIVQAEGDTLYEAVMSHGPLYNSLAQAREDARLIYKQSKEPQYIWVAHQMELGDYDFAASDKGMPSKPDNLLRLIHIEEKVGH